MEKNITALEKAITKAGGQVALAKAIGKTQQIISFWVRHKKGVVPAEVAILIESATGISRNELRPDLFGKK